MSTQDTVAIVFDFDDTLTPDSTTRLLEEHGINTKVFWGKDAKDLVRKGFDPTLAFLKLFLDNIGEGKPLGALTNQDLRAFGATLSSHFYPGLPGLFDDLRRIVRRYKNIEIKFYIVSGGLKEIIDGNPLVRKHFDAVYGCEEGEGRALKHIKRVVSFTEKTRYLFEINKGLEPHKARSNPYLVNKDVPAQKRRVPFKNMIYVGDGLTDIPCFSLVKKEGGTVFGVFNPAEKKSARRALLEFLKPARVIGVHAPRYRDSDELGSLLRASVAARCAKISVEHREAEKAE